MAKHRSASADKVKFAFLVKLQIPDVGQRFEEVVCARWRQRQMASNVDRPRWRPAIAEKLQDLNRAGTRFDRIISRQFRTPFSHDNESTRHSPGSAVEESLPALNPAAYHGRANRDKGQQVDLDRQ